MFSFAKERPAYLFMTRKTLVSLQKHSDELEEKGVLVTSESVDIIPIHVSPSFLVRTSHRFDRMVTAFSRLVTNMYCIVLSLQSA